VEEISPGSCSYLRFKERFREREKSLDKNRDRRRLSNKMSASPSSPEGLVEALRQILALSEGKEGGRLEAKPGAAGTNGEECNPKMASQKRDANIPEADILRSL
jgi:hypothetical protein